MLLDTPVTGQFAPEQTVIVAKAGGDYTTIAAALAAITDAGPAKPYGIVVYPGFYTEAPFTVKTYVALASAIPGSVFLATNDNNSPFITLPSFTSIKQINITGGPTNDAAIYIAGGAINTAIENVVINNGETGILCTGSGSQCIIEETKIFTGVTNGLVAETGARLDCANVLAQPSGTAFYADGGTLWLQNCGCLGSTNGIYANDGGIIYPATVNLENVINGIRTGTTGTNLIAGDAVVSRGTTTFDLLQENAASHINLTSCRLRETRLSVTSWAEVDLEYASDVEGNDVNIMSSRFHVGTAELGKTASFGRGGSTVRGMRVITTNSTATSTTDGGNLTDVTDDAASNTGSTFGFQGTAANHTILIGSTLDDEEASDKVQHWGLDILQTTAAVEVSGKSFTIEYWDGAAWSEVTVLAYEDDLRYRYGNVVFTRANSKEHLSYNARIINDWTKKTIDGDNLYWVRIRINTTVTTAPVFEQFKYCVDRHTSDPDGRLAFHGRARFEQTLQSAGNVWGESGGVTTGTISVGSGGIPTGWSHQWKNSIFNGNGDAIYYQFTIPRGLDTSCPLDFKISCIANNASAGNAILSVLPVEVTGILVADPSGGKVPTARTDANTETLTGKQAQTQSQTVVISTATKIRLLEFTGFDVSNYYEGDVVLIRLEGDNVGGGNVLVNTLDVAGIKSSLGGRV